MDDAARKVSSFINHRRLISPGGSLLLSLSAGKDSMALLNIMLELRESLPLTLGVFHLNHGTRGRESDLDEEFVRAEAERYAVPFHGEKFDFSTVPRGRSFEEYAREVRYGLLLENARGRSALCATAHTSDDNVETVLMRIFQGTGPHGLTGIPPVRGDILRPLLCLSSDEVYEYLNSRGIQWRDDASNRDVKFLRNHLRHEIIPLLEKRFPRVRKAVAGLAGISSGSGDLLDELLSEKYGLLLEKRDNGDVFIRYQRFSGSAPLLSHVLAMAFRELGLFISTAILDEMCRRFFMNRTHCELYRGRGIQARKTVIDGEGAILIGRITDIADRTNWSYDVDMSGLPLEILLAGEGIALYIEDAGVSRFSGKTKAPDTVFISGDSLSVIRIRNRRPGDTITLPGGTRKLKKVLIDQKYNPDDKDRVPLLEAGGAIIAVLGSFSGDYRTLVARDFMVNRNTKKILAIRTVKKYR